MTSDPGPRTKGKGLEVPRPEVIGAPVRPMAFDLGPWTLDLRIPLGIPTLFVSNTPSHPLLMRDPVRFIGGHGPSTQDKRPFSCMGTAVGAEVCEKDFVCI